MPFRFLVAAIMAGAVGAALFVCFALFLTAWWLFKFVAWIAGL